MWSLKPIYCEEVAEGGEGAAPVEAAPEPEAAAPEKEVASLLSGGADSDPYKSEYFRSDKFKTVEAQLKAYNEAEKRLGGFRGAPEEYALPEGVAADDELAKVVMESARKHNASQEVLDDILGIVNTYVDQSYQVNAEQERSKLGDNPDERLIKVENQLKNRFQGEQFDKIAALVNTAESVMLIEALLGDSVNLPQDDGKGAALTWGDIEKELTKKDDQGRYVASYDIEHAKKIELLKAQFAKQQGLE